jgi:RodZ C-terminal domain
VPETNFERVVFFLGLCAIGVLGFLVVREHRHGVHHTSTSTSTSVSTLAPATTSAATVGTSTEPAAQAQLARLVLTATRGDCWVVVRSRSARGKVIFAGLVTQGTKKRFAGARLWFRLGAAGNVSGRVNGARFALPPGTPTLLATAAGVRVLALR